MIHPAAPGKGAKSGATASDSSRSARSRRALRTSPGLAACSSSHSRRHASGLPASSSFARDTQRPTLSGPRSPARSGRGRGASRPRPAQADDEGHPAVIGDGVDGQSLFANRRRPRPSRRLLPPRAEPGCRPRQDGDALAPRGAPWSCSPGQDCAFILSQMIRAILPAIAPRPGTSPNPLWHLPIPSKPGR
jgi:hypothetical protein